MPPEEKDGVCGQHSGVCSNVNAVDGKLNTHMLNNKEDHEDMWEAINDLRNRLPVWATFVIALLTGICGWALR